MTSTALDRLTGLVSGVAIKAPCRVATTANITLSGTQTIDGVAVVADDRVLVKNQTDGTENGIYDVSATAWTRAKDFDGTRDVTTGTAVLITAGTTNSGTLWRISTTGTITIDTTSIAFSSGLAATTATSLATPHLIGGVSFDGTGNIVPQTIQIVDAAAGTTTFPMLATSATGSLQPTTDPGLSYNASTNALTASTFVGALTGNAGTATSATSATSATTATTAANVTVADAASDTTMFLALVGAATGNLPILTDSAASYNASTNVFGTIFTSVVQQVFTSTGTYTPTTGMKFCIAETVGAGGGGGGAVANSGAGGGGSGGYSRVRLTAAQIGASQAITIATGGAGGSAGANNGSAGSGDTSLGALLLAKPGGGGPLGIANSAVQGGSGGSASGAVGDITFAGGGGGNGGGGTTSAFVLGGEGGASYFKGGVRGGANASGGTGVTGGTGTAGGGGGGASGGAGTAAGGAGGDGIIIVTEFI